MKFPGAPYGLKIACGENPKRVYGGKGRAPSTRMGNVAGYRKARSEEHTSELQSLMRISYAIFCLKKKTTTKHTNATEQAELYTSDLNTTTHNTTQASLL